MKPRILMIVSFFYPFLGGAEQQAFMLAKGLIKRGFSVSVLTRKFNGLPSFEMIQGIPVYRNIGTLSLGKCFGLTYILSVFWFLYRQRDSYDIIHCHIVQGFHTIVAVFFKFIFKKKVIVKMCSSGETSDLKLLREVKFGILLLRWIRNVDTIISVCKRSSREILSNGFSKETLVEIPNGVDTNKFSNKATKDKKYTRNIIYIGRMDSYKGVDFLLKGFKELLSRTDNVRLTIVGSGPDETHLKNMAKDLGILDYAIFKGRQEDVLSEFYSADIFVLPSLSEGMSNVLLEAMSCGLPVVATLVGGNSDLIKDRYNGILIPPKDSIRLSGALLELLEDEELRERLGKEARKTVEENYSMDNIVDGYQELYVRLLS